MNNELDVKGDFVEYKQTTQQIYNDDFAGLKNYWVEEIYEEIIFKINENTQVIFAKMYDCKRNYHTYSIYCESNNIEEEKSNKKLLLLSKALS